MHRGKEYTVNSSAWQAAITLVGIVGSFKLLDDLTKNCFNIKLLFYCEPKQCMTVFY